ncbi:MAG TPA: hypothetical protein VM658_12370 [bacterium]|nr:hypothetical protein [bacterium]
MADIVITNNNHIDVVGNSDFNKFRDNVLEFIKLISKSPNRRGPKKEEVLMVMAYAVSQSSSCMQRKVGAIIADDKWNIISSGFNEVPNEGESCQSKYTTCYRKIQRDDFINRLYTEKILSESKKDVFITLFTNQSIIYWTFA